MALRNRNPGLSSSAHNAAGAGAMQGWNRVPTPYDIPCDSPQEHGLDVGALQGGFAGGGYPGGAIPRGRNSDPESPHDSPNDSPAHSPGAQKLFSAQAQVPLFSAQMFTGRKSDPESPHTSPHSPLGKNPQGSGGLAKVVLVMLGLCTCALIVFLTNEFMPERQPEQPQTKLREFRFDMQHRHDEHYVDMKICTSADCHADCSMVSSERQLHVSGTSGFHKLSHEQHSGIICNKPYYVDIKVCNNPDEAVVTHPLHYSLFYDTHGHGKPGHDKTCIRKYKGHPLHLNLTLQVNTTVHIAICPDGGSKPIEHEMHCITPSAKNQAWLDDNVRRHQEHKDEQYERAHQDLESEMKSWESEPSHWEALTDEHNGDHEHNTESDHNDESTQDWKQHEVDDDGHHHPDETSHDAEQHESADDDADDDYEAEPGEYEADDDDEYPYHNDEEDAEDAEGAEDAEDTDPYGEHEDMEDESYYEDDSHDYASEGVDE